MRSNRRASLSEIINIALNQTLSRTIITAGTALLSALALLFFGGDVLSGFAFTMVVGIVTGTYSSVFVAAAIVTFWQGRKPVTAAQTAESTVPAPRRGKTARKANA
jgi:preprotein translocase subunit SecF